MQQRVICVRSFGNIAWPAWSPELTVQNFPVDVPERPCAPGACVVTVQELKQVAAINEVLRRLAYGNMQTRLQKCIDVNGGHLPDVICGK